MKRKDRNLRLVRIKESWGVFCVLGIVMLNYPFLHIFNRPDYVFGTPLMVLYLLIGWPISIVVIYLFSRFLDDQPENGQDERAPGEETD